MSRNTPSKRAAATAPSSDGGDDDELFVVDAIKWAWYKDSRRLRPDGFVGWHYGVMWSGYLEIGSDTEEPFECFTEADGQAPLVTEFWKAAKKTVPRGRKEPKGKLGDIVETPAATMRMWFKAARPQRDYATYERRRRKELAGLPLDEADSDNYWNNNKTTASRAGRSAVQKAIATGSADDEDSADDGVVTTPVKKRRVPQSPVPSFNSLFEGQAQPIAGPSSSGNVKRQRAASPARERMPSKKEGMKHKKRKANADEMELDVGKRRATRQVASKDTPSKNNKKSVTPSPQRVTRSRPEVPPFPADPLPKAARIPAKPVPVPEPPPLLPKQPSPRPVFGPPDPAILGAVAPSPSSSEGEPLFVDGFSQASSPISPLPSEELSPATVDKESTPSTDVIATETTSRVNGAGAVDTPSLDPPQPDEEPEKVDNPSTTPENQIESHDQDADIVDVEAAAAVADPTPGAAQLSSSTTDTDSLSPATTSTNLRSRSMTSIDLHSPPTTNTTISTPPLSPSADEIPQANGLERVPATNAPITSTAVSPSAAAPPVPQSAPAMFAVGTTTIQPSINSTSTTDVSVQGPLGDPTATPPKLSPLERPKYVQPKRIKAHDDATDPEYEKRVARRNGAAGGQNVSPSAMDPPALPGSASPVSVTTISPTQPQSSRLVYSPRVQPSGLPVSPLGAGQKPPLPSKPRWSTTHALPPRPTHPQGSPTHISPFSGANAPMSGGTPQFSPHFSYGGSTPMPGNMTPGGAAFQPPGRPTPLASPFGPHGQQSPRATYGGATPMAKPPLTSPSHGAMSPVRQPGSAKGVYVSKRDPRRRGQTGASTGRDATSDNRPGGEAPPEHSATARFLANFSLVKHLESQPRRNLTINLSEGYVMDASDSRLTHVQRLQPRAGFLFETADAMCLKTLLDQGAVVSEWAQANVSSHDGQQSTWNALRGEMTNKRMFYLSVDELLLPGKDVASRKLMAIVMPEVVHPEVLHLLFHQFGEWEEGEVIAIVISVPFVGPPSNDLPNPMRLDKSEQDPTPHVSAAKTTAASYGFDEMTSVILGGMSHDIVPLGMADSTLSGEIEQQAARVDSLSSLNSDPKVVIVLNGQWSSATRLENFQRMLERPVQFYSMGHDLESPVSTWTFRQIWKTGGLVMFSPTFILREPSKFRDLMAEIRSSPGWAAYIPPATVLWCKQSWRIRNRCPHPDQAKLILTQELGITEDQPRSGRERINLVVACAPPLLQQQKKCADWSRWLRDVRSSTRFKDVAKKCHKYLQHSRPDLVSKDKKDDLELSLSDVERLGVQDLSQMRIRPHVLPYRRYVYVGPTTLKPHDKEEYGDTIEMVSADDFTAILSGAL